MTLATPTSESPTIDAVGPWRLEQRLGTGAFGTAWEAVDAAGNRAVVKILLAPPGDELRTLARIAHPTIVRLLGGGPLPVPHVVMERAAGISLADRLAAGPVALDAALGIVAAVADGLAACHEAGIVHGDPKPANIVVDLPSGQVRLVDFGLAGAGGRGGTLAYAAPERLAGEAAGPKSDVYALGLVLYELLHGALPWSGQALGEALVRRSAGAPVATVGPDWVRELVAALCHPDPTRRPTSSWTADTLAAHGVPLIALTPDDVARRARAGHVDVPGVRRAVERWLDEGGSLAIVGPAGSGRTHVADRAANELAARGVACLHWLGGTTTPWLVVEDGLRSTRLPGPPVDLPAIADPHRRAELAARRLRERAAGRMVLLVDDWEGLDPGSRETALILARRGAAVLWTGEQAPPGSAIVVLEPLDAGRATELVADCVGPGDAAAIARTALGCVGGRPGDLVGFVVAAVRQGAIRWLHRRWVADPPSLEALEPSAVGGRAPSTSGLPAGAARLGALVAAVQPIAAELALGLANATPGDLQALRTERWVSGETWLVCTSAVRAAALVGPVEPAVLRTFVAHELACEPVPWHTVGPVIARIGDVASARRWGARCVRATRERDIEASVRLAAAFWALAPGPELAAERVDSLARAGRAEEGRALAAAWLQSRTLGPELVPVLLALARSDEDDPAPSFAWIEVARRAGGDRPDIALVEARARFRAGDLDRSGALVAPLCAGPPPTDDDGLDRWLAARGLLAQIRFACDGAEAALLLLELGETGRGRPERPLVDAIRGRLLWHAGRHREAAMAMEAALASERSLSTVNRARLSNNAGLCHYAAGDAARAVTAWEAALVGFERLGVTPDVIRVQVNLCQGFRDLGRWERARQAGEEAARLSRALGADAFLAVALGNLGDVAYWKGEYPAATRLWNESETVAQREGLAGELVEIARRRAELAAMVGAPDALERASVAEVQATDAGVILEAARCAAVRALLYARIGHTASCRSAAHRALGAPREQGAAGELAICRLWVAEAWWTLGDPVAATLEARQVVQYADEFERPSLRAWADRVLERGRERREERSASEVLDRLTEVAMKVAGQRRLPDVLAALAGAAVDLIGAERAFVVLMRNGTPEIVARSGSGDHPPAMSVVRRCLSLRREVVASDIDERGDLRDATSVVAMEIRAVMCVPLVDLDEVVGVLYVDSHHQPIRSLPEVVSMLRALAAHATLALRNARTDDDVRRRVERAGEVAHDLRNPLGGMLLTFSDALDNGTVLGAEDLGMLADGARHAVAVLERYLDDTVETRGRFDWSAAVRGWTWHAARHAHERGIVVEVPARSMAPVVGQVDELRRAVTNLVSNAIKYSPPGSVVTVEVVGDEVSYGVRVRDRGPGVPESHLRSIFERGTQAPGAASGYGLGLAIVRSVAEWHGGSVSARNPADGGAEFTLSIPREGGTPDRSRQD